MDTSIFFPHFYLPNEIFIRHQFLYIPNLLRMQPSDRKPKDSKGVKQFIADTDFPVDLIPAETAESVANRFMTVIERSYCESRELYIRRLGKYDKERASTKTFHLCRAPLWPEVVRCLEELGLANVDSSGTWCFSTRQMVMTWNTCLAIENQRQRRIARCTDEPEYDELAALIECLPRGDGNDATASRAVLEFPYVYPENILTLDAATLQILRNSMQMLSASFRKALIDNAGKLETLATTAEIKAQFKKIHADLTEITKWMAQILKEEGQKTARAYGHYRWYINSDSPLAGMGAFQPLLGKNLALSAQIIPLSPDEMARIPTYPGCFLWTRTTANSEMGIGKRISNLFKRTP
ncbi:MAG: hypothetical protein C4527_29260 [Candidatus Omnitrophota bacterium]|jgi:hypothetical protein|nr:MAG: hypothetical protein C4527_29260 [Candidatus Omnitrophota bacterium]